jgi:hypothetical protein
MFFTGLRLAVALPTVVKLKDARELTQFSSQRWRLAQPIKKVKPRREQPAMMLHGWLSRAKIEALSEGASG